MYVAATFNTGHAATAMPLSATDAPAGFFGEFWRNSEANQFLHFHDSGLFVGRFGITGFTGNMGLTGGGEFQTFH